MVSVNARGARHNGQDFCLPSSPVNQVSTHKLHPSMFLQHRVNMTGGLIGLVWQMRHLKVSKSCKYRPGGSFIPFVSCRTFFISLWRLLISCTMRLSYLDFFSCGGGNSSSSLWLSSSITCFHPFPLSILWKDDLVTAYTFRLPTFQNFSPILEHTARQITDVDIKLPHTHTLSHIKLPQSHTHTVTHQAASSHTLTPLCPNSSQ